MILQVNFLTSLFKNIEKHQIANHTVLLAYEGSS